MATNDDLDPAQSQRRANDQLRIAMVQLDEHIQALTAPTMELALIQKKHAAELGLEERQPEDLIKKFVSQAGPGAKIGAAEPGQLNPDGSEGPRGGPIQYQTGQEQPPLPPIPRHRHEAPSVVPGVGEDELEAMQNEQLVIPQYGQFKVDAYLRMARRAAARKAETEPGTGEPNKWASIAGGLNTAIEKAPEIAATYQAGKSYLKPMLDIGFGASSMGRTLGFTPQAGGTLGASHILGIPNPIAAFTSPAAKQGLGTVVNAAEEAFGGTGIGMGEAKELREALAGEGWSNQRSGGAFGFTVGGQQENLAQTFAPLVKMGLSPGDIAPWTKTLRMGATSPEELKKTLEQIPETAKILHKTMEEVSQGMQEFAAKAVEGGTTILHGANAYQEIGKLTGISPAMSQSLNESPLGTAYAAQHKVLPWQIAGLSGGAQAENAAGTVKMIAQMAGNPAAVQPTLNPYGEKTGGLTAKQAKAAQMVMLSHGAMTQEFAEHMLAINEKAFPKAIGTEMQAASSGMTMATTLGTTISEQRHGNEAWGSNTHAADKESTEWHKAENEQKRLEAQYGQNPTTGTKGAEELANARNAAQAAYHSMMASKTKAAGEGKLTPQQEAEDRAKLPEIYTRVREAGLGHHGEIRQWERESPEKALANANAALAKAAQVEPEKTEKAKAEIVMNTNTEKWFKLQFPNAKSPNSPGAGGKSSASSAAQPSNESPTAMLASQVKQAEQIRRGESTAGAK